MADLFGDFEATPAATGEVDPMAAFLAREQELLGDDAALFGNTTAAVPSSSSAVLAESAPGDLFSAVPDTDSVSHHSAVPEPAQSVFTPAAVPATSTTASPAVSASIQEPESVKAWKDDFKNIISERDATSKAKHATLVKNAKDSLERFYAEYNDKKGKLMARNKETEKVLVKESEGGSSSATATVWERTVKLIDSMGSSSGSSSSSATKSKPSAGSRDEFKKDGSVASAAAKKKTKDTTRMKQLLHSLKADKKAPGAVVVEASV